MKRNQWVIIPTLIIVANLPDITFAQPGEKRQVEVTEICLCFSPDGKLIASGGPDKRVRLRDSKTGKVQATFSGHVGEIIGVAFSLDGKTLISAGDETVRLWDIASGKERATLFSRPGRIQSMAVSPNGRIIAAGHWYGIHLWDLATAELLETLPLGAGGSGNCLTFSPDGKTLASAGYEVTELWDMTTRKRRLLLGVEDPAHPFSSLVAFSPDGKTLAMTERSGITLWDSATGKKRSTIKQQRPGHFKSPNRYRSLAFYSGETLIVCNWEEVYSIYIPSGKDQVVLGWDDGVSNPLAIALSPNRSSVAVTVGESDIKSGFQPVFVIK